MKKPWAKSKPAPCVATFLLRDGKVLIGHDCGFKGLILTRGTFATIDLDKDTKIRQEH